MNPLAIIGDGRMGRALATALRAAGRPILGPLGREADVAGAGAVLLCVPDGEIANAAAALEPSAGRLVGHVSGATTLEPLTADGHEAFSLHPLMTVPASGAPPFAGASAAVAGSTPEAVAFARALAEALRMTPFEVPDEDRAAYHAAASVASNYLLTIQAAAERLLGDHPRELLVPLVRATVENWARLGPHEALTGPVARGDEATVARQRAAVHDRAPDLLPLFDALTDATRGMCACEI